MSRRTRIVTLSALALALAAAAGAFAQTGDDLLGRTTVELTVRGGDRGGGKFGGLTPGPGEPYTVRTELAPAGTGREARRRSLLYFAQLTDFQLSDEESPARVEFLDSSADSPFNTPFGAAWRPQEAFVAHMTEEAIRQVNAFVPASPVPGAGGARAKMDFALTTGDSADNQQRNETEAVVRLLDGGEVRTNGGTADPAAYSGPCAAVPGGPETTPRYTGVQDYDDGLGGGAFYDPDEPLGQFRAFPRYPGLMDRAQQPFRATGLAVPSYVTFGNHDGLVQGNQAANPQFDAIARGCIKPILPTPSAGPADTPEEVAALLSSGGAMLVPPDPDRTFISKPDYKALHAGGRDAHGFAFVDPRERRASRGAAGYYSWSPKPGFRFIAIDTVSEGGVAGPSANGNLDDPQFRWIGGQLDAARAAGELVVLFGHHPPRSLTSPVPDEVAGPCSGSDPDGADARAGCDLDPRDSRPVHGGGDLQALLKAQPNVVALVSGHTHENRATPVKRDGGGGFWEIETAAEIDFPHQNRLIEVMDNRDGTLSLFGTVLDHAAPIAAPPAGTPADRMTPRELASVGRLLGYNDPQSAQTSDTGQVGAGGLGRAQDRNVELVLPDPRRAPGRTPGAGEGAPTGGGAPPRRSGAGAACSPATGLRSVAVRARGRGVSLGFARGVRRPVTIDVFQHSARRRVVGERLVARFRDRTAAVAWSGRANRRGRRVTDGLYSVRLRMDLGGGRSDVRRVALVRSRGRFSPRPAFARRERCALVRSFKLERPVFGGRTGRALGIAYRLQETARVSVRVTRRGRTVRTFAERRVPAGAVARMRLDAGRLRRGDHRVTIIVRARGRRTTATLTARRI